MPLLLPLMLLLALSACDASGRVVPPIEDTFRLVRHGTDDLPTQWSRIGPNATRIDSGTIQLHTNRTWIEVRHHSTGNTLETPIQWTHEVETQAGTYTASPVAEGIVITFSRPNGSSWEGVLAGDTMRGEFDGSRFRTDVMHQMTWVR